MARPRPRSYLTPGEVARLFHVTSSTVARWAEEGRLPVLRTLGGHRRFPAAPVYALLASSERKETP